MKQTDPQFKFRLPPELKDRLDEAAAMNNRALGAEIVHRLEQSFKAAEVAAPTGVVARHLGAIGLRRRGRTLLDPSVDEKKFDAMVEGLSERLRQAKKDLAQKRMEMAIAMSDLVQDEDGSMVTKQELRERHAELAHQAQLLEYLVIDLEEKMDWLV